MGTLCQAIGNHKALSLFLSTAWFDCVSNVCCNSAYCASSKFPGLGFESQSRSFFQVFFPFPNFLQRSTNGEYFSNDFVDWLIWVVIGVTSQKIALTGIRTPDLETWNLKWNWNWHSMLHCSTRSTRMSNHAVEENKESAQWLPIASHSVPTGLH